MTVYWWLVLGIGALAAASIVFAYLPWRKRIRIAFDPSWRRDARLMTFTVAEEARAAANPLLDPQKALPRRKRTEHQIKIP